MAETKKKSQYNFGGHNFDTALYLQNLRDNAESFLNSKTDWTPEQKEEWKHSYTNFTNALQDQINNNTDRFSTDEFGTITDRNGEFSNTDTDNFYYNNKGQQIGQEDYDKLKTRKQNKFQTFEANRQFASYANQVGKSLRDAIEARKSTSNDTNGFDYAKNGFASFWNNKYNPSGEQVDRKLYWALDKDGQYTNRIAQTLTDLDEYLKRDDLPDDVRANVEAYKNKLQEYSANNKDFNVEEWKNGVQLAASRAGLGTWNNGFFNMGSQDSTVPESNQQKPFDINNDQDVINKYNLAEQIAAHPEQREHLLDLARREYNQESQNITDQYNTAIKQEQDAKNNKIWEQWLANNQNYANVSKRNFGTEVFGNGYVNGNSDFEYASGTSQEAMRRLQNAFKTGNRKGDFLRTSINMTVNGGKQKISNLGEALAYYKPLLDKTQGGWDQFEKVQDAAGNEIYKLKGSENAKGQPLYIWFNNGRVHAYRDDPYSVRKAQIISRAQLGMKLQTKAEKEAAKQKANQKEINNPSTPEDRKRQLEGQRKPGDTGFTPTDIARITSAGLDVASAISAYVPVYGTAISAGTGLASSFTSLGADWADKSVSAGDMWKNLGANVAMDVVGLIPGFGTAGKAGKITKTLVKYVPRIITALSAANALSPESRASWAKLTSNESLTVRDWQNIAAGCSALAGISRGAVGHFNAHTMAKGTKTKNFNITASDGKQYKVTAEQLETLKKQKSLEDVNKEFKKIHPNAELSSFFRNGKWQQLRHLHFNNPQVKSVYDFSRLNNQGTFSNSNIWKVARENNLRGISLDVKNPYKNTLLKQPTPSTPSKKKYEGLRTQVKTKQQIVNAPLNNSPERYNYVRRSVQSNTGDNIKTWRDIFTQNHFYFKEGGSIQKLANGDTINGNPWYSGLSTKGDFDVNKYKYNYNTNQLYAGDMSNGPTDFYVSNQSGQGVGRYAPTNNTFGQSVTDIENQDYYKKFGKDLLNQDGTFTPMGEKWAKAVDAQLPSDSTATFYDNTGKLRTKWTVKNNDSLNRPARTYTNLAEYVERVRNDQILGARHNVFLNTGNRYFYRDKDGIQHWVDPEDIKNYQVSEKPVTSGWNDDKTVYWNDYELTGANSKIDPAKDKKPQSNNFSVTDLLNKLDVTDKWGIPRAMYADITNRKVTDMLKKQPLLLDPQEDHRYIQSDLDAEMNGQQAAAQLDRLASQPMTSDGSLQTAAQLDAVAKGNEAITQGRQQSNQRLRDMAEKAWEQEVVNHTNRHNTAMQNRESIYNTANENKALEAAYLNQKFTVWDALAQEKEFKAKSDYEQMRARADQFAQGDINNAIKYGLSNYAAKYGLTPEDVSLWNKVYVDGTMRLDDIQKDPVKLKQWNKVLSATRQIQQDLLGEYYGIPKSKYWTVRQESWGPTTTTQIKSKKKGGHINLCKVREAAKGEKLAAAQLKAQTADADRFYKTTKDHIDRMYDAISRTMNYSRTKKKRKKKSS